jgi:Flp pilus assembly protein TadG
MRNGARDETGSRGGRSLRDDRGMTAVEFVILTPLLFLLLMLTVQFALYLFAKQAATAAVQEGARTARDEAAAGTLPQNCDAATAAWQQDAVTTALKQSQTLGGQLLLNPTARTSFTTDPNLRALCKISLVRVDLHSAVPSVFPGFGLAIDVHAGGPVEQPVRHP